jgi:hypothetical protein
VVSWGAVAKSRLDVVAPDLGWLDLMRVGVDDSELAAHG